MRDSTNHSQDFVSNYIDRARQTKGQLDLPDSLTLDGVVYMDRWLQVLNYHDSTNALKSLRSTPQPNSVLVLPGLDRAIPSIPQRLSNMTAL